MFLFEKLNTPIAVIIALAFFLAVDGFLLYRYQQTQRSPEVRSATVDKGEEASANAAQAVVRVVNGPAWLSIQEDGQTVLEEVREPGFSEQFEADQEIVIRTGNAGAVRVEANGRDFGPLGESGESVTARIGPRSKP
jgi:hypothetical protein